jgi:hypothetical protein
MTHIFTRERKPWKYTPIMPDVLWTTQLPLPPAITANTLVERAHIKALHDLRSARSAHDAAYWGERTRELDFTRSDHADTTRFNRILWVGLRSDSEPYPVVVRLGRNLRVDRKDSREPR